MGKTYDMAKSGAKDFDDFADLFSDLEIGVRVSDTRLDKMFPVDDRVSARVHWTPVAVAMEAVKVLIEGFDHAERACRILDVGSNVGKFCVVGALTSPAYFTGVEKRRQLVDVARATARRWRIPRVSYKWADMASIDWSEFDGIYLYNPFYENIEEGIQIDQRIELHPKLYASYVATVEQKLASCRSGTKVVAYYGFGGKFPPSFSEIIIEDSVHPRLECWVKN